MNDLIENIKGSERSVEIPFTCESILEFCRRDDLVLEVGGVPTTDSDYIPIREALGDVGCNYEICDFRGGKYKGDFVTYDFGDTKFDVIMFISSLEHFPQCTEGDMQFRESEDRRGFQKALDILNPKGKIILTVPFGKPVWQKYHQNYNMEKIKDLTEGSSIIKSFTYKLDDQNQTWVVEDPLNMEEVLYTTKAYGVGCFILEKNI
jgi:SAM-dependent methyltransferase